MGKYDQRRMHNKFKTKRKTKDIDEIHEDMKPAKATKLLKQDIDYDLPGNAQFYCLHCARYFVSESAMKEHFKSKQHKRRLKKLESEPYTQEEADRAGGLGSYVPPKKQKVKTQDSAETMEDDDNSLSNQESVK